MDDERDDQLQGDDDVQGRFAPRNPFAVPEAAELPLERPALIQTRRSAALAGVVVGLVALFFFVLICVFASYAFG